jgi:hypothetical protein
MGRTFGKQQEVSPMKINLTKILSVLMQLIAAAPTIAAAVKPVLDEVKKPGTPVSDAETAAA